MKIENKRVNTALNFDNCFISNSQYKNNVDLRKIKIFNNERLVFLVNDDSKTFFEGNFWKILNDNPNQMVSCFLPNVKSNYSYKYVRGKKALSGVNYFSISKALAAFTNIPSFLKFVTLPKKQYVSDSILDLIIKTLKKYEYIVKGNIFDLFKSKIGLFYSALVEIERWQNYYTDLIKKTLKVKDYDNANKLLEKYRDEYEKGIYEILSHVSEAGTIFLEKFIFLSDAIENNVDYLGDSELTLLQNQYNFMKKLSNPTMIDVKKELIIRDNANGIKILHKLAAELKANANEELRYLCDKYNHMSNIDMLKASKYPKNSLHYQFLIRKAHAEKYIYKSLKSRKSKLLYLDSAEIQKLINKFKTELKIFIDNSIINHSSLPKFDNPYKIYQEIEDNFDFNLDFYIELSSNREKDIKKNIVNNLKIIKDTKDKFYKVKDNFKFDQIKNDLKNRIEQLSGEIDWRLGIIKNTFNLTTKNSKKFFIDVKKVSDKFVKITANMKKIGSVWNYLRLGIVYHSEIKNEQFATFAQNLNNLKKFHLSFANVFNKILALKSILFDKRFFDKKTINSFYLFVHFIDIFEKSSIHISNLVKSADKISYTNKIKLSFISELLSKPRLVIIEDDPSIDDINLKLELIRVIDELSKLNNNSFMFITNDKRVLKSPSFDFAFMIASNKDVEHGSVKEILERPFNPIIKANLQNNKSDESFEINDDEFMFSEEIKVGKNHYIVSSFSEYKTWVVSESESANAQDENTLELKIDELNSAFLDLENIIVDIKKGEGEIQNSSTVKLYEQYKKYLEHKNNTSETLLTKRKK
ncbi:MAG1360 family OppF-related protein [Mycoplasmopsis agalactiae]|uniref:MAG1360 family OppF-related protein n=1 Tax=Mycoplasmopsis agalactiae TaxID=2110 RepID=UPI002F9242D3